MRNLLAAIFIFITTISIGQKTIFPAFEVGSNFGQDNYSRFVKENYVFGAGVILFDHLGVLLNFGYYQNRIGKDESKMFKNDFFNTGLSLQYRVLKNTKISPLFDLDFYTGLQNNQKIVSINDSYDPIPETSIYMIGTFERYPIMFSSKMMADWGLNCFHLQLGGGYNVKSINYLSEKTGLIRSRTMHGFEISLNLMYVLKSKDEINSK